MGLQAQSLHPIQIAHSNQQEAKSKAVLTTANKTAATLTLPFFEDFSGYTGMPDTNIWMPGGGVYVNNFFPIRAPSVGVATFEGLDGNGDAYQLQPNNIVGSTDTLTSRPIDLSLFALASAVGISYYWQGAGLGELPNASRGDSIMLEFKAVDSTWDKIWSQGGRRMKNFEYEQFLIDSVKYLHDDFQFRFRVIGKRSGLFDIWNLDYIVLKAARTAGDSAVNDLNAVRLIGSYLKGYTAVPFSHLDSAPSDLFNDSITFRINSLNYGFSPALRPLVGKVEDLVGGGSNSVPPAALPPLVQAGVFSDYRLPLPAKPTFTAMQDSAVLKLTYFLDDGAPLVGNRRVNDTVSIFHDFKNYYAYDDGSPEATFGINQRFSKTAYLFDAFEADTIIGVDIAFPQNARNLSGQGFNLSIVGSNLSSEPLYGPEVMAISYNDERANFVKYDFDSGDFAVVSGTFHVVFQQFTDERLNIGADFNNISNNKIFFALSGNAWQPIAVSDSFSLMVRPRFGTPLPPPLNRPPGGLPNPGKSNVYNYDVNVGPNPLTGNQLRVDGKFDRVEVFNFFGVRLHTLQAPGGDEVFLTLPPMQDGLYVFRFTYGFEQVSKKIFIKPE